MDKTNPSPSQFNNQNYNSVQGFNTLQNNMQSFNNGFNNINNNFANNTFNNNFNNNINNNNNNFSNNQIPEDIKKQMQKKYLRKKSNGIGLYVISYFASLNGVVVFIVMIATIILAIKGISDIEDITNMLLDSSSSLMHYMTICASVFAAFFPGLIYCKISKNKLSNCLQTNFVKPSYLFPIIAIGLAGSMLANFATEIVINNFGFFGLENTLDFDESSGTLYTNILYVISTAITPAFAEEFAFRGIIMGTLRKYGDSFAIIVSSLMFGAMHGNIVQIPFAFMLGLLFAFIDCKTNSLIPSIILHFLNNFYAVLMDISQTNEIFSDKTFYIINFSIIAVFCIFGLIGVLCLTKKDKNFFTISDNSNILTLTLKEKVLCFLSNPGIIISLVIFFIESIFLLTIDTTSLGF